MISEGTTICVHIHIFLLYPIFYLRMVVSQWENLHSSRLPYLARMGFYRLRVPGWLKKWLHPLGLAVKCSASDWAGGKRPPQKIELS